MGTSCRCSCRADFYRYRFLPSPKLSIGDTITLATLFHISDSLFRVLILLLRKVGLNIAAFAVSFRHQKPHEEGRTGHGADDAGRDVSGQKS